MPDKGFHWLDVERIAEELSDAYPGRDPYTVRFTELRELVQSLPDFAERPGHPVNERILEAIQSAWAAERDDSGVGEDDDGDD
ncbi:MAG: Fe-S cluster assembly protein IscX [Planctomycetota bacterium]|nr:Fe-S cluster assembly protein IscX [Planctomycetota bacterium]